MRKLLFLLMVCLPATGWSANLDYALEIQINPHERKITGTARIKSYADMNINLMVRNLHKLKVDGSTDVNTADDSINLTVQNGQKIIISYEATFNPRSTNFIDTENVFLIDNWYPRPNVLVAYDLAVTLPENFIATSESESGFNPVCSAKRPI